MRCVCTTERPTLLVSYHLSNDIQRTLVEWLNSSSRHPSVSRDNGVRLVINHISLVENSTGNGSADRSWHGSLCHSSNIQIQTAGW